jgi:hypothetical protein
VAFGVFDLGLDETGNKIISPEFQSRVQASNRLRRIFNQYYKLPQVYAVKNISTGEIIGRVLRNAAARKLQRSRLVRGAWRK